jgi:hypothetical protein
MTQGEFQKDWILLPRVGRTTASPKARQVRDQNEASRVAK